MRVLITGGSGLIGQKLTERLLGAGHQVGHLGRSKSRNDQVKSFQWDPMAGEIDEGAVKWPEAIIHLAGAGIAEKRWTEQRKTLILESRKRTGDLLFKSLKKGNTNLQAFVAASAIGFYGGSSSGGYFSEDDAGGDDFQGRVCQAWEGASRQVETLGVRTVILRIGVVLSQEGGALPKMALPIKLGVGTPLGTGRQVLSWIHEDDLVELFMLALEDGKLGGTFNAVAPEPVTNREFTRMLAKALHRWTIPIPVPSIFLKLLLGEMAEVVLEGNHISSRKIQEQGYKFKYSALGPALKALVGN